MLTWYTETLAERVSYFPAELDSWWLANPILMILGLVLAFATILGFCNGLAYILMSVTWKALISRGILFVVFMTSLFVMYATVDKAWDKDADIKALQNSILELRENLPSIVLQDYIDNEIPSEGIVQLKEPLSITDIKDGGYIVLNTFIEGVFYEDTLVYVVATDKYPSNSLVPFSLNKYESLIEAEKEKYTFTDENRFFNKGLLDISDILLTDKDGTLLVIDKERFELSDIKYIYNVGELKE